MKILFLIQSKCCFVAISLNLQEAMKNANELIEEEERDRKKAEKRRAKKKVQFEIL